MNNDQVYDYIIIGAGPTGSVCAYLLSQKKYSCLILEKNEITIEKCCGGGVPHKALDLLSGIGMRIEQFLSLDVCRVYGDVVSYKGHQIFHEYKDNQFAVGTNRVLFDKFLIREAIFQGAIINYNNKVTSISKNGNLYLVNGNKARNIICCHGSHYLNGTVPKHQTIGITAKIRGVSTIDSNLFYFWYKDSYTKDYFWAFPISSKGDWNIGYWAPEFFRNIKSVFNERMVDYITPLFNDGFSIIQPPKAEFIGIVDQSKYYDETCLGDAGGYSSKINGGGIYRGILSSIKYCNKIKPK